MVTDCGLVDEAAGLCRRRTFESEHPLFLLLRMPTAPIEFMVGALEGFRGRWKDGRSGRGLQPSHCC